MSNRNWKSWQYKNTSILIVGLVVFFYFVNTNAVQNIIERIGTLGYFGGFLAGIFFVSIFTVAPAAVIIFDLANNLNPLFVAVFASAGAVIGDYLIFRFLKDRVFEEISPAFQAVGGSFVKKLFLSPFFAWLIPIAGALIIASPLPDEVGISLMGLSRVKNWQFILVTFLLNAVGIFFILALAISF